MWAVLLVHSATIDLLIQGAKNGECSHHGLYSIAVQNSRNRFRRLSGGLPAMMPALMAPLDVPITQSGSMPASWSAS